MRDFIDEDQMCVLVVDDNGVDRKLEQRLLEKAGYRTAVAVDGAECIKAARTLKPDLILLDFHMPLMNGLEVCHALKSDLGTRDIPLIFVTSNTDDATIESAFDSGGTDYVKKPINRIELLSRVKSALTQKRLIERVLREEKLQGVIEMAAAVCHEMNQPLQAISGYSQLLMMQISEEDPVYEKANKIKDQVFRMADITNKLMGITKYETRQYVGNKKIIDIDKASGTENSSDGDKRQESGFGCQVSDT